MGIGQSPGARRMNGSSRAAAGSSTTSLRRASSTSAVVRSTHARARIVAIDTAAARALPGVARLPRRRSARSGRAPTRRARGSDQPYVRLDTPRSQLPLARGEVRYVGEPIAAVIGPDPYAGGRRGRAGPDRVRAVARGRRRRSRDDGGVAGGPRGREQRRRPCRQGDRRCRSRVRRRRRGRRGPSVPRARDLDGDRDARPLRGVRSGHRQHDGVGGAPGAYHLRSVVAARLGLPAESVRVIAPDTGGGFGPKEGIYPEDVLVPLLAHHLGRPVKWIQTRTEFLSSSHQARQQAHHARLAATHAGRVLGLDVRIVKDVGAYHYFSGPRADEHDQSPALSVQGAGVSRRRVRGRHQQDAERAVSRRRAARRSWSSSGCSTGSRRSSASIPPRSGRETRSRRRRCRIVPASCTATACPSATTGATIRSSSRRALDLLDYAGWRKRQADLRADGRRIGLGIAGYLEAGGSVRPGEWATVKVDDRGHVEVLIGVSGSGQGHETVFAQVCAGVSRRARSTTSASAAATRPWSRTAMEPEPAGSR